MNLLEIKSYLMTVKITSLASMCTYFNCDSQLLRVMLWRLLRTGKVRCCKQQKPECSAECIERDPLLTEIYEWV